MTTPAATPPAEALRESSGGEKPAGPRLRLLLYITPSGIGGAEVHLLALARKLGERGHRVSVVCPKGRPLASRLEAAGLDVRFRRTFGKLDPFTLGWLSRLVGEEKVQLIHTHLSTASLLGGLAGRRARVPVVSTVHGLNSKTCYTRASLVIAVSNAVKRHLVSQGLPSGRIRVIRGGVDLGAFERDEDGRAFRAQFGISAEAPVLVAAGRLSPEKGHRVVLEATRRLLRKGNFPHLRLLIIGEGDLRRELAAEAGRLGLGRSVIFTGFLLDVVPALRAADVCVLPSLKEGLSLSVVEAMAAGKPVVASRVGGLPEVVLPGETGLLVPPGDPEKLAAALHHLLTQPEAARQMGEAGRLRAAECFNLEDMVTRTEEVYWEALGSSRPGRDSRSAAEGSR